MEMRRGKTQLDKMSKALNPVEGRRGRGRGIHLRELTGDYEQRRALTAKVKGGKGKENYAMRQKKKAVAEKEMRQLLIVFPVPFFLCHIVYLLLLINLKFAYTTLTLAAFLIEEMQMQAVKAVEEKWKREGDVERGRQLP